MGRKRVEHQGEPAAKASGQPHVRVPGCERRQDPGVGVGNTVRVSLCKHHQLKCGYIAWALWTSKHAKAEPQFCRPMVERRNILSGLSRPKPTTLMDLALMEWENKRARAPRQVLLLKDTRLEAIIGTDPLFGQDASGLRSGAGGFGRPRLRLGEPQGQVQASSQAEQHRSSPRNRLERRPGHVWARHPLGAFVDGKLVRTPHGASF